MSRPTRIPMPKSRPETTANVFYFQASVRPYCGSCAIVNHYLNQTLEELGFDVRAIHGDSRRVPIQAETFVPLAAVGRARRARDLPPAKVSIHCDFGLTIGPVRRKTRQKNVVFFHGLTGAPGQWAGNELVDRYWGNSRYMQGVVQSLLALPDWRRRRLFEPRAFGIVSHLTLALPCLEEPDGALQEGIPELPWNARMALDQGDIFGHAVTPEKVNEWALYNTVLELNRMAQERGLGRRFRVFIAETMFRRVQASLALPPDQAPELAVFRDSLEELGLTAADLLVPVPHLAQSALFEILRACKFGFFYNLFPEPFGFYPLESVFHGCPVYTNGVGNLRYLLPAGHGIHVHETEALGFGEPGAYLPVAEAIYHDTVTDPSGAVERCRRGADFISKNYNREAFRRDVATELEQLETRPEALDFESLVVRLSPLVRLFNPSTRRVLTDHSPRELSDDERRVAEAALGRTCGEIGPRLDRRDRDVLEGLFLTGILALSPPSTGTEPPLVRKLTTESRRSI